MEFPKGFPDHLKPAVDAAIHRSEVIFSGAREQSGNGFASDAERLIRAYIMAVFFAFAYQAARAGEEGLWDGERIRRELKAYLENLIHRAFFEKYPSPADHGADVRFMRETIRLVNGSRDWTALNEELSRVAESRIRPTGQAAISALPTSEPETLGARLDRVVLELDISHEEMANRIGISRSTYFEVKAGRSGRQARRKAEIYLSNLKSDR